jgi:hypothetical protein
MVALNRLDIGARRRPAPPPEPRLLLLRSAIGLLAFIAAATTDADRARDASVADAPAGPAATAEPAAAGVTPAAGTRSRRQRAVFVCDDAGTPVFSDRPCGAAARRRAVSVELPAAGQTSSTVGSVPRASTRPRIQPDGQRESSGTAEPRCTALREQLEDLDDRMRSGDSSREAARLWDRWRDLKSRLRAGRC